MEIESVEFPKSLIDYHDYYNAFCDIFSLMEKRERITTLKEGIVIEIRNKEEGHSIPHIHAYYQGDNISISLIDCSILAGNIPKKNQKIAVEWVKNNLDDLRMNWKSKHGVIIFPDMNAKRSEKKCNNIFQK